MSMLYSYFVSFGVNVLCFVILNISFFTSEGSSYPHSYSVLMVVFLVSLTASQLTLCAICYFTVES